MKILKTAEQKNFIVNKDFYTDIEIWDMLRCGLIFSFGRNCEHKSYSNYYDVSMSDTYRIYADYCKEVKTVYNKECGIYENIVVTKNGMEIHINL